MVEHDAVVYLSTQYLYDDPNLAISAASGALSQSGRPFAHGFEFYLEGATISFEFANLGGQGHLATPLSVILPDGTVDRPDLPGSGDPVDAFTAELDAGRRGRGLGHAQPDALGRAGRAGAPTLPRRGRERPKTRRSVAFD